MPILNIGLIGSGNFAQFLLESYKPLKKIKVRKVFSRNEEKAKSVAQKYDVENYETDPMKIIEDYDLDIIVIATPPFLHAKFSSEALKRGKNVLCEKPLALTLKEAQKVKSSLKKTNEAKFSMNYVMRRNPIVLKLKEIIDSNLLGDIHSISFNNYASTSGLDENHWFWDKKKSGGIWIEHGVHFFDMFRFLLNESPSNFRSTRSKRPGSEIEDFVSTQCNYGYITASFTHSFTATSETERTFSLINFERGSILISGWIPDRIEIQGVFTESQSRKINSLLKNKTIRIESSESKNISMKLVGRQGILPISRKIHLTARTKKSRDEIYKDSLREIISDLADSISNSRNTDIDFNDSYKSLEDAIKAETSQK